MTSATIVTVSALVEFGVFAFKFILAIKIGDIISDEIRAEWPNRGGGVWRTLMYAVVKYFGTGSYQPR